MASTAVDVFRIIVYERAYFFGNLACAFADAAEGVVVAAVLTAFFRLCLGFLWMYRVTLKAAQLIVEITFLALGAIIAAGVV